MSWANFDKVDLNSASKFLIMIKWMGPSADSCGTPLVTGSHKLFTLGEPKSDCFLDPLTVVLLEIAPVIPYQWQKTELKICYGQKKTVEQKWITKGEEERQEWDFERDDHCVGNVLVPEKISAIKEMRLRKKKREYCLSFRKGLENDRKQKQKQKVKKEERLYENKNTKNKLHWKKKGLK